MAKKPTLGLCMIVKNEQEILTECLNSLESVYDEIVIVDTGSTDNTIEIAKKYTSKVYSFEWVDDFSKARNYALSLCNAEYILTWDADWILRRGDSQKIRTLKTTLYKYDMVYFCWNVEFGNDLTVTRQSRYHFIFKKNKFHWESPIHNELVFNDKTLPKSLYIPDIEVFHHKDPVTKSHRYEQTQRLILKELKTNPNNVRLRIFYAQGLQFEKGFDQAIEQYKLCLQSSLTSTTRINCIERIGQCYFSLRKGREGVKFIESTDLISEPRILLILADLYMLINPFRAFQIYKQYCLNPAQEYDDEFDYYPERYLVYPFKTLSKLYLLTLNFTKSKEYANLAKVNSTHSKKIV